MSKEQSSLAWRRLIFVCLITIGGLVWYDANLNGGFNKSGTKKFLINTGLWEHGQTALKHCIIYSKIAIKWLQNNVPVYYAASREFLQPYNELVWDLYLIVRNAFMNFKEYFVKQLPVVVDFIEQYAPGLVDKIVEITEIVGEKTIHYFNIVRNYLETEVFVGQLSPQNLQKATITALNTTQQYATRYYDWFYQFISNLD